MKLLQRITNQQFLLKKATFTTRFVSSVIENPLDPSLRLFPVTELVRTHSLPTSPSFLNPTSLSFSESDAEYIVSIPVSGTTTPSLHLFNETFLVVDGLLGKSLSKGGTKGLNRREFSLAHPLKESQIKASLDISASRLEIKFDKVHVFQQGDNGEGISIPVQIK